MTLMHCHPLTAKPAHSPVQIAPTGGLSGVLTNYAEEYGRGCLPILAIFVAIISGFVWLLNLHSFLTIIPQCGMVGFKLGCASTRHAMPLAFE
tara:strand:- start:1054 stop:1332 length:279 start_codon:yes stop_codon:yes gene_type:complete